MSREPFFHLFSSRDKKTELHTGKIAKERLQRILLSEKTNAVPDQMEQMEKELRQVLGKYIASDEEDLKIQIDLKEKLTQGKKHVKTIQIKRL